MSIRKTLKVGLVALESVALVLLLSACTTGGTAKGDSIAVAIDKTLTPTPGYSMAEGQGLTQRDRLIYESTRHGGNHPVHTATNGTYVVTPADEGRIWHWGS